MCLLIELHNLFTVSYAFELVSNPGLMSIDLSSLIEIRGGGLRYALNPQLCYSGSLPSYLADPENQFQCVVSERRTPNDCSKLIYHHILPKNKGSIVYCTKL